MKHIELGEVVRFIRGITFTPQNIVEPYSDNSVVCFRTKNIQNDIDIDDIISIPRSFVKRNEQFVQEGDLLLSSANSFELVGKSVYVPKLNFQAAAGGFISIVRAIRDKVLPRYLYHWIGYPKTQHAIRYCGRKTTNISNLNKDLFLELKIPLPHLDEQHRIAAILDKADAICRKRKEAITLADSILKSVFLDMFGDPVTNPKGWPTARLSEIAEIVSGVTKGKRYDGVELVSVPYMRVANVQDGHILLNDIKEIEVTKMEAKRYLLSPGDILLTEGGDPDKLGRGSIWHGEITNCIHQNHIFRVRMLSDKILPEYLNSLIGSTYGKQYFLKSAKQTTGIASINKTQLSNFSVYLPDLSLQNKYKAIIDKHTTIRSISTAFDKCNLLDSLMHIYFI